MNSLLWGVCLFMVMAVTSSEKINIQTCQNANVACTIPEVRIDPCPEANENKACKAKRGRSQLLQIDYQPDFDAAGLVADAWWVSPDGEILFNGLNRNACEHTTCPVQKGVNATYIYNFPIDKKYPLKSFDVKWVLKNADKDDDTEEKCCFIFTIKVIR